MKNNNDQYSGRFRLVIQMSFVVFSILLGMQFRNFVLSLESPVDTPVQWRPPAVEAYLPISSLMSLTYFAKTGIANRVHPAGLVIFSASLILAVLIRRGFCAWVCPLGAASEWAYKTGAKLFGRNLLMPYWIDVVLRSLKYLVTVHRNFLQKNLKCQDRGLAPLRTIC